MFTTAHQIKKGTSKLMQKQNYTHMQQSYIQKGI